MELRGHEHVVECLAFAPLAAYPAIRELGDIKPAKPDNTTPGLYVATGGRDKVIKIWDSSNGACLRTLVGHDNWIRGIVWSPNGKYLLSVSDDKTLRVWDLGAGGGRCSKTIDAHGHFVTSIAWARAKAGGEAAEPRPDSGPSGGAPSKINGTPGGAEAAGKTVNAVVTTCVDMTIKVWTP